MLHAVRAACFIMLLSALSATETVSEVDALFRTMGKVENGRHITKVMLIGDSQTRYLFCQLASLLLESCRSRNTSCPPSSPRPEARLSFAWVSRTWPPLWWLNRNDFPVILRFLCVEYLTAMGWVHSAMRAFLPEIVVGGRGCWDLIRRIPHILPSTMTAEVRMFIEDVVRIPSVRVLVLFPMWQAQYPVSDTTFEVDSPLTACGIKHLQQFVEAAVEEGLRQSKSLLAQRGVAHRIARVPRDVLLRSRPQDGIHFNTRSVAARMAAAVFGELSPSIEHTTHVARLDYEYISAYTNCAVAGERYYSILYHQVLRKTSDALRDFNTSSPNLITTALRCTDHWLFLFRYLGPLAQWDSLLPPFESGLEGSVTKLLHSLKSRMNECEDFLDKIRLLIAENELISKTVEAELIEVHRMGTHPTCKATGILYTRLFFSSTLRTSNAFESVSQVFGDDNLAPNCLNEPFGGWP